MFWTILTVLIFFFFVLPKILNGLGIAKNWWNERPAWVHLVFWLCFILFILTIFGTEDVAWNWIIGYPLTMLSLAAIIAFLWTIPFIHTLHPDEFKKHYYFSVSFPWVHRIKQTQRFTSFNSPPESRSNRRSN